MPSTTSPPYKVGVVGYGLSAKIFHIPFILDSPAFTLHGIVQRSPTPQNSASADHPSSKIYKSADELIADPDVQVVVLTTAPDSHFELASAAIKAGKHVLVEKPFTPTSRQGYDLVKLAKEHNVFLTVYQNRRYDADFVTLKSLLQSGALGRVADFESHFDRHRPDMPSAQSWKTDPSAYSVVFDLGTHLMDQVVSIYGLPQKITGFVGTQREGNTTGLEDSFTAILHFDDSSNRTKMMATCRASVVSPEKNQLRYWVRGTKGSFKKCNLDPQEDQLKAGIRPGQQGYGQEHEDKFGVLTTAKDGGFEETKVPPVEAKGYTAFYEQFAKALKTGEEKELPVDAQVAADVIRLCELVRQSSSEGKTLEV